MQATDKNTIFQREVSHFSLKHLILYIAHNIIHENIKQGKELEQEESKGLSQMSEEEENELMLPDLPKKILEKLKKYKGAIILNEMPLEIQFPSDKFLDLLLEDWLVEGPEVNFTPNQSLSLQCRAELLNIFHSFHSHQGKIASSRLIAIQNRFKINHLRYSLQGSFKYVVNVLKMLDRMHDGYQLASVGVLAADTVLAEVAIRFGNVEAVFKVTK